jgi:hypothetical protein
MNPHWVLFKGGYPSALMLIRWHELGGTLPASLRCATREGAPTDDFRKLWSSQFPTRDPLPDVISNPDGKPTLRFIEVFR